MKKISFERVNELLSYSASTGVFCWKVQHGRKCTKGSVAGGLNKKGYWMIAIDGVQYMAHRLAWLISTGQMPENEIDHKNGFKSDNRIDNLRDVCHSANMQNQTQAPSNSTSGLLGVSRRGARWRSQIKVSGQKIHIGTFDTAEAAYEAYLSAKSIMHREAA